MNKRIGIIKDPRYYNHRVERYSPENPDRLKPIYVDLENFPYGERLIRHPAREATETEITAVHSPFYIEQIRSLAHHSDPFVYDKDTYLMEESLYTAKLAAGGCLELADRIMGGELDYGFALVRPPGHHAETGRGMGFCLLNNVAVTAAYLRKVYGLRRILIVDYDVHHGNGTQDVFLESDSVMFMSIHQQNIFPFSGSATELGREAGLGYTLNIPVYAQFGDPEYTYITGRVLGAIVEQFMPQIILVSAGFDGHRDDTLSDTLLSTEWYGLVAAQLRYYASETCDNRLMFILEGGYKPETLRHCVLETLDTLMADRVPLVGVPHSERAFRLLDTHPARAFWSW
jgi:acetoin utilization deacetylase AcuC-like enzyme